MIGAIRFMLFEGLILGSTAYALLRGGAPERLAAIMLLIAWLVSLGFVMDTFFLRFDPALFLVDLALFAGLFLLSLVTQRFWPIWMCAMQGVGVLGHVVPLITPWDAVGYAIMTQFWGYPIEVLLIVATRRHRLRLRRYGVDPAWVFSPKPF